MVTRRRNDPGAGSGSPIARAIVVAHGGRIWVEGAPGGGTVVVFELPVWKEAAVTTVLVVDDEPQIRRALRTSLEAHGYDVATVGTGEEGVLDVADSSPDLVLLDLGLPGHGRHRGRAAGAGVLRRAGHRPVGA